ncbi:DEAD/DEAH box helicase [Carnobacteriaceae bacterium zg-ZUI240]|nr:DEAD/DEAH box helicase [Carnobacteriaceae bacterium zg-ZUI240]
MNLQLNETLMARWEKAGFEKPTAIQKDVFQKIIDKQHVVAVSPTGTGKTLAYVLPLLTQIKANGELQLLVLAPSQELAQQIAMVIREWSDVKVQAIVGGANLKRQIEGLKNKPEVIVATPGRLKELADQSKKIKFHQLQAIVIDEADYLLSDEHLKIVREIVKKAPGQVQKLFFSATTNENLLNVEKWFGVSATFVNVKEESRTTHLYLMVDERKRLNVLKKMANHISSALVFVQNVGELAMVYEKLMYEGIKVAVLHSDMHHIERKKAIEQLKKKEITYLLTTDVASRGIDVDSLEMVIQYNIPREQDIYMHRSGRTGRMGNQGIVLSLVNEYTLKDLKRIVPKSIQLSETQLQKGQLK